MAYHTTTCCEGVVQQNFAAQEVGDGSEREKVSRLFEQLSEEELRRGPVHGTPEPS